MSDLTILLQGTGYALNFQAGFTGETETAQWWGVGAPEEIFTLIPSGPVLFQTSGTPPAADETLQIAEDEDPAVIASWTAGGTGRAPRSVRTVTLPANQLFRQFLPVLGPFAGMAITGTSALNITPGGLVSMAPSTVKLAASPLVVVFAPHGS